MPKHHHTLLFSRRGSFRPFLVFVLVILMMVLTGLYLSIYFSSGRYSNTGTQDRLAVENVDAQLAREIRDDPELRAEYGVFLQLDGEGFERKNHAWMMWPRMEWKREAVFENGRVPLRITLFADTSPSLGKRQWRIADWYYDSFENPPGTLVVDVYPRDSSDEGVARRVNAVALSEDAARLLIAGPGHCEVWDTRSRELVRSLHGKFGFIERIEYADSAAKIAISSRESSRVLDLNAGTTVAHWTKEMLTSESSPIDISRDGKTVLGNIRDPKQSRPNPATQDYQADRAPRMIATIHRDGRIKPIIVHAQSGESARHVFLSPDGNFAMFTLSRSPVEIWWDVRNERVLKEEPVRNLWQGLVAFGPRSGYAYVWRKDFDHPRPPVRRALPSLAQNIKYENPANVADLRSALAIAISSDERWLALLTEEVIHVWDVATGKLIRSAKPAGFACWMEVALYAGLRDASGREASSGLFRDGKAISIGEDARLKLVTHNHGPVALWIENSR
jgi:hypothetical protein